MSLRTLFGAQGPHALRSRRISVVPQTAGLAFTIPGTPLPLALSSPRD